MLGAIEAGGTKFNCAVSDDSINIIDKITIPTTTPEETMGAVIEFFKQYPLSSIGVGSFGPIDVNPDSETYGFITTTPKPFWGNYDFVGALKKEFDVSIAWTTDVNAAAYGEIKKGAAIGKNSCLYLTVGTGVGGGAIVNGEVLTGFGHPEMGHIKLSRHPKDGYKGKCPYHNDCLEGLAAGPAIEGRTGVKGQALSEEDPSWEIEAYYLAQALMAYTLVLSPEMIILGGGVMKQEHLLKKIHNSFLEQLNGYVNIPPITEYIVSCKLADEAGITGCLLLAKKEKNK